MTPFSPVNFGNGYYPLQAFLLPQASSREQWIHLFYCSQFGDGIFAIFPEVSFSHPFMGPIFLIAYE